MAAPAVSEGRKKRGGASLAICIGAGLLAFFILLVSLAGGSERGIPAKGSLKKFSGHIESFDRVHNARRMRRAYRSGSIAIKLEDQVYESPFKYQRGRDDAVWNALCVGCPVTLWVHPDGSLQIYQIAVNGRMVRTYEERRMMRVSQNEFMEWLAIILALVSLGTGIWTYRVWNAHQSAPRD